MCDLTVLQFVLYCVYRVIKTEMIHALCKCTTGMMLQQQQQQQQQQQRCVQVIGDNHPVGPTRCRGTLKQRVDQ